MVEGEIDIYRDSPLRYLGARRLDTTTPPRRLGLTIAPLRPIAPRYYRSSVRRAEVPNPCVRAQATPTSVARPSDP